MLLETYSAAYDEDTLLDTLPKCLTIEREVTGDPAYSMYNLSLKEDWKNSKKYYVGADGNGELIFFISPFVELLMMVYSTIGKRSFLNIPLESIGLHRIKEVSYSTTVA